MIAVPLRHRLRNRPAVFVGRSSERSRLAKAIRRAPVSVVVGPGGFGKTALVLATLHEQFADRVAGALHVALDAEARADARVEVVRALAEAEAWQIAWSTLLADPDALAATAIDLAEREQRMIVIDDLHLAAADTARALLAQFARYARASRLVCTSRELPEIAELSGQVLALEPMPTRDLKNLAREIAPSAAKAKLENALRLAAGSPWRLQQALSGALTDAGGGAVDVLAGLSDDAIQLLRVLSILERPLPATALAPLGGVPDASLLERLEQRGLVERASGGIRLDHLAADLLDGKRAPAQLSLDVAEGLAQSDDRAAWLEAVRLWIAAGRLDRAAQLLDRFGHELLESGAAPELWRLLESIKDPLLALWRMRTAVQLGERRALEMIGQVPPRGSPDDVLAWAGAMLARGALDEALDAADRLVREAPEPRVRFEASIVAARALLARADLGGARQRLEQAEPDGAAAQSLKSALLAVIAACAGDPELALSLASRFSERLTELPLDARLEVTRLIAGALETGGRPADAAYVSSTILTELGPHVLHSVQGRLALCTSAIADTECGHLERAAATLERLTPFAAGVLGPSVEFVAIDLGIARGDFVGLAERVEALLASTLARRQASHYFAAARLDLQLRALLGRPPPSSVLADLTPPSPAYRQLVELRRRALALLSGEPSEASELASEHAEVRIVFSIVAALSALAHGDAPSALELASTAVSVAHDLGFGVYEAEALELRLSALLLHGRFDELGRGAEQLEAVGHRMGSMRFSSASSFWAACARPRLDRPELLQRLATCAQVTPVAARRAQALLGDHAELDVLDRRIVEAQRARAGWEPPELVTTGRPGSPAWGIDEQRRAVWLSDGALVDLTKRDVPWRLLQLLADSGGHADKEAIALKVWGSNSYHPLRHDNRLRLAVRELRRAIEVDFSKPERVLTSEDGYALGGSVRRLARSDTTR